jgi:hypothetical protein
MAEQDDMATRLALLEKTMVTRDFVADREDKLLLRFEALLGKHESRMDESMKHAFKVYGHDIADQLRTLRTKVNEERDEKLATALRDVSPAPVTPPRNDMLARWGLPLGVAAVVGGPGTVVQVMNLINALT